MFYQIHEGRNYPCIDITLSKRNCRNLRPKFDYMSDMKFKFLSDMAYSLNCSILAYKLTKLAKVYWPDVKVFVDDQALYFDIDRHLKLGTDNIRLFQKYVNDLITHYESPSTYETTIKAMDNTPVIANDVSYECENVRLTFERGTHLYLIDMTDGATAYISQEVAKFLIHRLQKFADTGKL